MDAQKFFHDVNYEHRLRDSPHELYQFRERIISPLIPEHPVGQTTPNDDDESVLETAASNMGYFVPAEDDLPNGVFTLLTDCYSPTCTRDKLCYSITCPRRWEQVWDERVTKLFSTYLVVFVFVIFSVASLDNAIGQVII